MLFSDQVSILSTWFKNWNECEQTVALFSLLKRVQKRQAKFLARCLEHGLKDCLELIPVEKEANDAGFIGRLINEPQQEKVIKILLSHLPLLRPGNNDAKTRYLDLLPRVLAFAVESSKYLQESRQLLSYSLIHPAFDNDERSSLTSWMEHLDDRIPNVVPENNYPPNAQLEDSQNANDVNHNRLWKDDPALLGPSDTTPAPLLTSPTSWQASDNNGFKSETNQTNSLSPGHRRTEDIETHQHTDTNKSTSEDTNAAEYDFISWLKSLRLHKYNDLFASMKYDEMMQLNEHTLSKKNVTKGARDKILLNVKRLHERFEKLQGLEKEIPRGGSLRSALNELKSMIYTPIIRFESPPTEDPTPAQAQNLPTPSPGQSEILPGDIPGQFTKVLGKACTQLLISKPDKDNITLYLQLLEKCMHHTAFTSQQKKRLQSWKWQINKIYRSLPRNQQMSSQRSAVGANYPNKRVSGRSLPSFGAGVISPAASPAMRSSNQLSMFPAQVLKPTWYGYGSNTHPTPHTVQPPIEAARKTASLDPSLVQRPAAYPVSHPSDIGNLQGLTGGPGDTDISKRLDSLSLSVAEHALSDADRISTL
ncbi:protein Smaug homolog 2-like [Styela clava]